MNVIDVDVRLAIDMEVMIYGCYGYMRVLWEL